MSKCRQKIPQVLSRNACNRTERQLYSTFSRTFQGFWQMKRNFFFLLQQIEIYSLSFSFDFFLTWCLTYRLLENKRSPRARDLFLCNSFYHRRIFFENCNVGEFDWPDTNWWANEFVNLQVSCGYTCSVCLIAIDLLTQKHSPRGSIVSQQVISAL